MLAIKNKFSIMGMSNSKNHEHKWIINYIIIGLYLVLDSTCRLKQLKSAALH